MYGNSKRATRKPAAAIPFAMVSRKGESIGAPAPCARTSVRWRARRAVEEKPLHLQSLRGEQVSLLRRPAGPEGARDVLAPRGPLRRRERRHELRAPQALEEGHRPARPRRTHGPGPHPRPVLRHGRSLVPRRGERQARLEDHGPRFHAAHARRRGQAPVRRAEPERVRAGRRPSPSVSGRSFRRRDGGLRPAQHRRPARGPAGDAPRARAPKGASSSSTSENPTAARRASSIRPFSGR